MAGSVIIVKRLKNGDHMMLRFEERRGDRTLRNLWTKENPSDGDLVRLEAFLNGRKCNCAKSRS